MAAVLALVMVPLLAALGFFVGVAGGDNAVGSSFAMFAFVMLGAGMLIGLLRFVRGLEN
jgi:hypothetical protein